jgi:hypothetical protein
MYGVLPTELQTFKYSTVSVVPYASLDDAPSPHLFFLWMASLAKKQPQHQNALPPALLPSGNVPTQRYVAMSAPASPLHSFDPLAAASELIAPQLSVFEIPYGIPVLGWDYIECNSYW